MANQPLRVLLSRTAELHDYPAGASFVPAVDHAVIRAGHVPGDMTDFTARDDKAASYSREQVGGSSVYPWLLAFGYGSPGCYKPDKSYVGLKYDAAGQGRLSGRYRPLGGPYASTLSP